MVAKRQAETVEIPHPGPTDTRASEEQVNMRDTVPQRIDKKGTKIEDLAGTGQHDGSGG
jgi:hypothetical protein